MLGAFALGSVGPLQGCASPTWRGALDDAGGEPLHVRAELELIAGDAETAAALAERSLSQSRPGTDAQARAFFALVVASDALGAFERPLPFLARVLDGATDPEVAARVAVEASRAWARLDTQDAASPEVRAALERLAKHPGAPWEEARSRALRELITAERLRDGPLAGKEAAAAAGFILDWKLSAPWGDAPMLDFTSALGPENRPLQAEETTGAGWDLIAVPTASQTFSDGEVTFFEMPSTGAIGFAEASLPPGPNPMAFARPLVLRLESNRLATVFVGGQEVLSRARPSDPWLVTTAVTVQNGERVTVKLATPDGRGFFRLQVSDIDAPSSQRVAIPSRIAPGDGRHAVRALLDLEELLSRPAWDPDGARERAARLEASFGPHTSLDLLAARLALGDSAAPAAERRQLARARYEAVLERSPAHPVARRGLARIERDEERPDRALAYLLSAAGDPSASAPLDVRTRLDLLDLYRSRGWEAEALATADALTPFAATSPRLMQELIDLYKAFGRVAIAAKLAAELEERFRGAGIERLYQLHADFGDGSPADTFRLYEWEPQRHAALRAAVAGLRRDGKLALAAKMVADFLTSHPNDGWALAERARIALQGGDIKDARRYLTEALAVQPDFAPLEALGYQLLQKPEVFDNIEDGRDVLARWQAFKRTPAGAAWEAYPIVNLLERTKVTVRRDGSTIELSHRVRIVQTKQGADELGDVRPPEGVRLLVVRTLKADGRVLEPERTEGKAELSFPELQPGDAVETAWVSRSRVARSEGGYVTGVSFAAWGAPIFELEAHVYAAAGIELSAKLFGGAPAPAASSAPGLQNELAWSLSKLPPIAKEPLSVSPRSFFPFADVRAVDESLPAETRNSDAWLRIARAYHSRLLHLGQEGMRTRELAARFLRMKDPAGAAFEWIKTEVTDQEQLNSFETPVEAAIANKKGNRALVLWALLRAMRLESQLLLCAPERDGPPEDRLQPTPNPNRFFYPIVAGPRGRGTAGDFDPARPYTPAGDLPPELGGAICLCPLASLAAPVFVTLPPQPDVPTFEAELALELDADGHARGTLHGLARGASASPLRQAFLAQDDERQRVFFEQWLASLAVGARLVSIAIDDAATSDEPMRWTLEVELRDYATRDGDALVVQRPLKTLVHSDFAGVAELAQLVSTPSRVTPLRLLPFSEVIRLKLVAPPGMRLVAPPPDIALRGISQESTLAGDTLTLTRRIMIRPGRVNPSEYDSFRGDIAAVIRALEGALRFAPAR